MVQQDLPGIPSGQVHDLTPRRRRVVQISSAVGGQSGQRSFFALCDDGTIWQLVESAVSKVTKRIDTNWLPVDTAPLEKAEL